VTRDEIIARDKAYVWHPYTAMDAYIAEVDPIVVHRARGSWLEDIDGTRYIDGNSSWWTASLGHGHPRLLRVLREQSEQLAHCALGGIAHEPAARLAEELCAIAPKGMTRAFFTDNGSTSIEVAVKMAVQMWQQSGAPKKTRFIGMEGAFHGDTIAPSSIGGVDIFKKPFASILFDCVRVPFPDRDAYAIAFDHVTRAIQNASDTIAAVVVEPIVQGTAGMRMYDPAYLTGLRELCTKHDVLLIVDEVFAGYGRTGKMWGCDHAQISPDITCLGKTFASILPMGAALTTSRVFDAFRGGKDRALYYGHTFCGHPLGAALAREVLAIFREEEIVKSCERKIKKIKDAMDRIAKIPGVLGVRSLGMIGAADLEARETNTTKGYFSNIGWRVYDEARKRGAYLRPLGDTVYICPPLTIDIADLDRLLIIFEESITAALRVTR
jgi:adenosylmethionine-8-amino-7-oxononanoate aminotransferase